MAKDEYYSFTEMVEKGSISKSSLYRLIMADKIRRKKAGAFFVYSLKDVINNKPRKK